MLCSARWPASRCSLPNRRMHSKHTLTAVTLCAIRSSSGAECTRAAVGGVRWMSLVFGLAALYFVVTSIQFWVTKYSTVTLLCAVRYLRHLALCCAAVLHVAANAFSWPWVRTFLSHTVARTECGHTA